MFSAHQAYFPHAHGNLTLFLCRIAFLLLIVPSLVRGDDRVLFDSPSLGPLIARGTQSVVTSGTSLESQGSDFQHSTGSTTTRSGDSYTYKLSAGWNLISINLELDPDFPNRLLDKGVMTLNLANNTYVFPDEVLPHQAYWIYCPEEDEFEVFGTALEEADFEASLKPGWNFVGPLNNHNLINNGAIAWGWNGHRFYPTTSLLEGHGYWLYWPEDQIMFYPNYGEYLVVDLSAGPSALSYPVSTLSTPPAIGWGNEYKTTKLVLRRIQKGTFIMGSPVGELGRSDDETQHQVTLTEDFYMGVFEVTQKQWERVMGNWPSYFNNVDYRDTRPVEQVSYEDIRGPGVGVYWPDDDSVDKLSFMGCLRAKTGLMFDLPTEAQWEYACRAGATTSLNSGKNLTDTKCCPNMDEVGRYWYNGGSIFNHDKSMPTWGGTDKVGSYYLSNQWGLHGMHGNVKEWCLDRYQEELGSSAQTDPKGATVFSAYRRVSRGGDWHSSSQDCRSAKRSRHWSDFQDFIQGFRLAMTVQ